MTRASLEEQLTSAVGDRLPDLWRAFVAPGGTPDVDRFVVWLRERGEIDDQTAQQLLLAERLQVGGFGGTEATFADPMQTADVVDEVPVEGQGHTELARIGAGAMGEVFLVRDEALRRKVAMKRITERAAGSPVLASRFLTEAQITAQLEHPSIIPVYQFERDADGVPSYTMKLIQGQTLKAFLADCRRAYERGEEPDAEHDLEARLEPFLKVCDAMAYAHARGVIHRDLKPDNVMLGAFGEVVVMDWGIARVIGAEEEEIETLSGLEQTAGHMTRMGQALGTPAYMSPEQALGENDRLDGRSDLVALGLILYEVVTLERAYEAPTPMAILALAQEAELPPVKARLAGLAVPRELAAVVGKATARRPKDRYPHVAALAEEIRRFLRGDAVLAAPDTPVQRLVRWSGRHRQLTAFTMVAALLVSGMVALASAVSVQAEQAQAERREADIASLLGSVGGHAHSVDAQLLRYTALLESLGATARATLSHPPPADVPVFRNADFADGGAPPEDAFLSERYWQRVSFAHPVLKLAPEVEAETVRERMTQLASTGPVFRELFLRAHAESSARLSPAESEALLRSDRVPVVWSYVAVEEGIHTSFPGHGGYPPEYDPRQRPWYLAAVAVDGPHWGAPYVDINGLGLILPCNLALRDGSGSLLGVAGLELTFGRVIRDLLRPVEVAGAEVAYLVDEQGKIVVSSEDKGTEAEQDDDLSKAAELEDFPVPAVVDAASTQRSGTLAVDGQLYAWTRLVTIDWTYIVRGPAASMLDG